MYNSVTVDGADWSRLNYMLSGELKWPQSISWAMAENISATTVKLDHIP